jgi:hypothetical protein
VVTTPLMVSATEVMVRQTGPKFLRRSATEILATSSVNGRRRTAGMGSPFSGDGHALCDADLNNGATTADGFSS